MTIKPDIDVSPDSVIDEIQTIRLQSIRNVVAREGELEKLDVVVMRDLTQTALGSKRIAVDADTNATDAMFSAFLVDRLSNGTGNPFEGTGDIPPTPELPDITPVPDEMSTDLATLVFDPDDLLT